MPTIDLTDAELAANSRSDPPPSSKTTVPRRPAPLSTPQARKGAVERGRAPRRIVDNTAPPKRPPYPRDKLTDYFHVPLLAELTLHRRVAECRQGRPRTAGFDFNNMLLAIEGDQGHSCPVKTVLSLSFFLSFEHRRQL